MLSFKRTDSSDPDFQKLVVELDRYLSVMDGEEHAFYDQFNKITNIRNVIICYEGDRAVGCGAFKPYEAGTVEIKRMYVDPQMRGKGIGLLILHELENWATESGYSTCILETGKRQVEAISLYRKAGYTVIPSYGQYLNVENSVCMKKPLG